MNKPNLYDPLQIELLEVVGLRWSMQAMRLPTGSSGDTNNSLLGKKDAMLARKLIMAGDDHAKAIRGIQVYLRLKFQVGWMIEFDTYRIGVETLSTSSSMHQDLKGMKGAELAELKQAGLPSKIYERIIVISYQALRNIHKQRRHHRHPDWQIFCDFIETLPLYNTLINPVK